MEELPHELCQVTATETARDALLNAVIQNMCNFKNTAPVVFVYVAVWLVYVQVATW